MAGRKGDEVYAQFATGSQQSSTNGTLQRVKDQLNPANHSILENALATLVLVLFVITIMLAITHGAAGGQSSTAQCSSQLCLERSAQAVSLINQTVNPCNNFFEYACGRYRLMHKLDASVREKTVYSELLRGVRDRVEAVLMSPIKRDSPQSYERKVKTYFQKCNDDFETEKLQGMPLALELGNGFYVLNASVATSDSFDLNSAMVKTFAGLGAPALFQFYVMPNVFNSNLYTISIDKGGLGMNSYLYLGTTHQQLIDAYKQYMRLVAEGLAKDYGIRDAGLTVRINQFVDDVIEIETRLANITRTVPSPNRAAKDAKNLVTLSEMDRMYPPLNWTQFFAAALDNKPQASTKVAVQSPDYVQTVIEYFAKQLPLLYPSDFKRKQSNYLNWRVMQLYTGDMSSKYVHAKREFEAAMSFRPYRYESKFDYCFRRVEQFMQKALSAMYVKEHSMDKAKAVVDNIYKKIQERMIASVDLIDWFDSRAKSKAKAKLSALKDRLAYFEQEIQDSFLDNYYESLKVEKDDYTLTISISAQNFLRKLLASRLGQRPNPDEWDGSTYDVNVHLNNPNVEITVPAGALHWPVFNSGDPNYIAYGSIGVLMAKELIKAIDSNGHFFDENGNSQSWWTDEIMMNYVRNVNCTNNYFAGMTAGPYVAADGTAYTVEIKNIIDNNLRNLVAVIDGLRLSRVTYEIVYGDSERPLPFSGLTNVQAFYVSWAQNYCYVRDAQYSYQRASILKRMPEEIVVNGAVSLTSSFAKAFQCDASSKMVNRQCTSVLYD